MTRTTSLPTTKHAKLVYLLDHWDDIFSPPVSSGGQGAGNSTPHLSPMVHHRTVLELARCLALLKAESPRQHDHLKAFYCAEWRVHTYTRPRRRKGGKVELVTHRERQRIIPAWVRLEKVRRGEERIVELFQGVVFIPEELWDALTLSSAEIDAKDRRRAARVQVA